MSIDLAISKLLKEDGRNTIPKESVKYTHQKHNASFKEKIVNMLKESF